MYYVHGRDFPMQIVETGRLPERENLWLASLRDDLTAQGAARRIFARAFFYHKGARRCSKVLNLAFFISFVRHRGFFYK
jgi:hypothetical protein